MAIATPRMPDAGLTSTPRTIQLHASAAEGEGGGVIAP